MASEVISCPACGAGMNHHANKIVYGSEEAGGAGVSEALEEFHECPRCGASVSRPGALNGHT